MSGRVRLPELGSEGRLFVIDTSTNAVVREIAPAEVEDVAVSPDGAWVYVSGYYRDIVSVIDAQALEIAGTISFPLHSAPAGIAFTPDDTYAFVALSDRQSIAVIDTATHEIADMIPVSSHPTGIVMAPDGRFAYVVHNTQAFVPPPRGIDAFGLLSVIDVAQRTVAERIFFEYPVAGVAVTPDGAFAYVTDVAGRSLVIERATGRLVDIMTVGQGPRLFGEIQIATVPGGCEVPPVCPGDCDGDGLVSVAEVVTALNVALGTRRPEACAAADADGSGRVTIEELIAIVQHSLAGCE